MSVRFFFHAPPGTVFPTSSLIRGHIELDIKDASKARTIDRINLMFYGRAKVTLGDDSPGQVGYVGRVGYGIGSGLSKDAVYYHSKSLLFSHVYTLTNPSFTISPSRRGEDGGTLTFPFQVRVPTHSEAQHPDTVEAHGATDFPPFPPFPGSFGPPTLLPDSFDSFWTRTTDFYVRVQPSIVYTLRAEVPGLPPRASHLWIGGVHDHVDVPVFNLDLGTTDPSRCGCLGYDVTVRSLRLLPQKEDAKLSFREQTRSLFKKSSLPAMDLTIWFRCPEVLWLDWPSGKPLPFTINVSRSTGQAESANARPVSSYDEKGRPDGKVGTLDDVPTPRAYLKRVTVELIAHTWARAAGWNKIKSAEGFTRATIFDYEHKSKSGPRIEVPVGQTWMDLGQNLGAKWGMLQEIDQLSQFGLVAQFDTPSVVRRYSVGWRLRLDVAGEDVDWETGIERTVPGGLEVEVRNGDGQGNPMHRRGTLDMQQGATMPTGEDSRVWKWEGREAGD